MAAPSFVSIRPGGRAGLGGMGSAMERTTNSRLRDIAAPQVSIAINAQVPRGTVATRKAMSVGSAMPSDYRTMSDGGRFLEDVIPGMLLFRDDTRMSKLSGHHRTLPIVWAAFNFILPEDLSRAVFVGVADGRTLTENQSMGPHDGRVAVCIFGMRTILNTGSRRIERGRVVVWAPPRVRPTEGGFVTQIHAVAGTHPDLLTASVYPLDPGTEQTNAALQVHRLLLGQSTTTIDLQPHLSNASRWAVLAGVYALHKATIRRVEDTVVKYDAEVFITKAVADGGHVLFGRTEEEAKDRLRPLLERLVSQATKYEKRAGRVFPLMDGMSAALFYMATRDISEYYNAMLSNRIGVAQSSAKPGEYFDILIS